jgi:hypothetical protein
MSKEIIKKHIPDFHQWHGDCQKQVIDIVNDLKPPVKNSNTDKGKIIDILEGMIERINSDDVYLDGFTINSSLSEEVVPFDGQQWESFYATGEIYWNLSISITDLGLKQS